MNREALIAAMQATAAVKPIAVEVAGWGTVYVKPPTVEEVDESTEESVGGNKQRLARGAARVICDENGKLLFDHKSEADVALLSKQPWSMLKKVLAAVETQGNA